MDIARARKEGVSPLEVLVRGNRFVSSQLPLRVKLVFWLTNGPYWALAMALAVEPPALPASCGPSWLHAMALLLIAIASSVFHGAVLSNTALGGGRALERLTPVLLGADMIAANAYGFSLAFLFGIMRSVSLFSVPILLLMSSAYTKRSGRPVLYAALHGTWHLLSAAAMWRVLYVDDAGVRRTLEQLR